MCGKSSQSTQQVTIPPEVLARYNSVNATAEQAASTPFQQYSTDPNAFVAPLTGTQQAGIANTNAYAGTAQPYYAAATQQVTGAQNAALPYYAQATQSLGQGQDIGSQLAGLSMGTLYGAQGAAAGPQQQAGQAYRQAYAGAQPFNQAAAGYTAAGAQAVNPEGLGAAQIGQYMSPYLQTVLQGTAGLQDQMNQQAMAGQTGNAIRQGAFGGDRAGLAAANLAQQQQLANAQTFSNILNQGYGQALSTAQGQQQLGLGAAQANRAAQQQAAQQALAIGQQQFGQGLGYGQAQAALGQQQFGQGATTAQQLAALGQQQFGQGATAAQQAAALGSGIYGMGAGTAQQLAGLGAGAQAAGLQGAQAQLAAGQAQQQTQQAGQTALYNQFLQQQSYPFQVAQFLANIAEGTGALSGSTTTTNQAQGGFSDARLKENIRKIGKTFDGQNIYSYNFKGSPKTEIGLMAQEVEHKHPEAVGLAGGYKTVRYDMATDDAAAKARPHKFGGGGLIGDALGIDAPLEAAPLATALDMIKGRGKAHGGASMGGGVMPGHEGEGFYDGGFVGFDPGLMQQINQTYQQMYAPVGGHGAAGGLGAAGYVPAATSAVGQLHTAGNLPAMQDPVAHMNEMGKLGGTAMDFAEKYGPSAKKAISSLFKKDGEDAGADASADDFQGAESGDIFARGGLARAHYASGGMPYEEGDTGPDLNIPDDNQKHDLLKPADPPQPLKDNTADYLKLGMMAFGAKRGGAIEAKHYASGGLAGADVGDNPILRRLLSHLEPGHEDAPEVKRDDGAPSFTDNADDGDHAADTPTFSGLGAAQAAPGGAREAPNFTGFKSSGVAGKGLDPEIVSFFKGKGAPDGMARAIAAGIHAESGSNPNAVNPKSGAFGLGQLLGDRQRHLFQQFGRNPSKTDQLEYLWGELNGGDRGGKAVLSAKDESSALNAYITNFMRPKAGAETEGDISRGMKAMGYAAGGLAGRKGYNGEDGDSSVFSDNGSGMSYDDVLSGVDDMKRRSREPDDPSQYGPTDGSSGNNAPEDLLPPKRGLDAAAAALPAAAPDTAGAQPKRHGILDTITHGGFVQGLGQGKAESWIPLLTGLATWGTTPTRSALSGALAGLGAGAQAAQQQRQYELSGRQVGAIETEALSGRIRANADLLRAEMTNAQQLDSAINNTLATIGVARRGGLDTGELNASLVALYNRRNALVNQSGGQSAAAPVPTLTKSPVGNLKPFNPKNPQSIVEQADVEQLGGGTMPSTKFRLNALGQGITVDQGGKFGQAEGYAPAKGGIATMQQTMQQQAATNRAFAEGVTSDYTKFRDAAPVIQALPHAIAEQPKPEMIRDLQTKLAGALGMSPQQAAATYGNSYTVASLVPLANQYGISINPDNPVAAVNTLLKGLHNRFDNLEKRHEATMQVYGYAKRHGLNPYDPRFDYPIMVNNRVYGGQ